MRTSKHSAIQPLSVFPIILSAGLSVSMSAYAGEEKEELQDMSDPLAVYTQAGAGISDKGFNLKVGQSYDTGSKTTMGMNVIEVKGFGGELLDIRDEDEPLYQGVDDSIDSVRFRNLQVDLTNGRGRQIDIVYSTDSGAPASAEDDYSDRISASYSFIQALPKMGPVMLYPLAGIGIDIMDSAEDGYELPGSYFLVGMYSKLEVTDKIWINYNPMYMSTLSGSDWYEDEIYAGDDSILTHEFAISYQINPRLNIRYFANWNEEVDFDDGDHRIEFNYQL